MRLHQILQPSSPSPVILPCLGQHLTPSTLGFQLLKPLHVNKNSFFFNLSDLFYLTNCPSHLAVLRLHCPWGQPHCDFLISSCFRALPEVIQPQDPFPTGQPRAGLIVILHLSSAFSLDNGFPVAFSDAYSLRLLRAALWPLPRLLTQPNTFQNPTPAVILAVSFLLSLTHLPCKCKKSHTSALSVFSAAELLGSCGDICIVRIRLSPPWL